MAEGPLYTLATWKVKPGREAEFIAAWQAFAEWTSSSQSGAGEGILLQEEASPNQFVSLGPWGSAESVAHWRAQPEFEQFLARARELCEELKPQTMTLVGRSVAG